MALTTISPNNKLTVYKKDFIKEWARSNLFSPYKSTDLTAIFRVFNELKNGGEQINLPILANATGAGVGSGTLTGNEEDFDSYGMRGWIDWARNAVAVKKSERHKDSADLFGEARPWLNQWADDLQRDETIEALMSLPSESAPANLGSNAGDRVNGIRYADATPTQRSTWNSDNSDRVLYGNTIANYNATHATALANVDATNDLFGLGSSSLMKYVAKQAKPKIRPYKADNGKEYFVAFHGSLTFRDLQAALDAAGIDKDARAREGSAMDKNPLFQGGDELYRGVIHVEVPEIDTWVDDIGTSLKTAGANSIRVNPVFLCGQSALAMLIGQMPKPTQRSDTDYGFIEGVGVEMAYGFGKVFKKTKGGTALKQWGMVTGFFAASGT